MERFYAITRSYFRKCHGVLFICGFDDLETLRCVPGWVHRFKENYEPAAEAETVPKYIVANKWDIGEAERKTSPEEGMQMCLDMELPWRQCSAKTGFNVDEIFQDMCKDIIANRRNYTGENRISSFVDKPPPRLHLASPPRANADDCFAEILRRIQFFGCGGSAKSSHR